MEFAVWHEGVKEGQGRCVLMVDGLSKKLFAVFVFPQSML